MDDKEAARKLLAIVEDQFVEIIALRSVLELEADGVPDWRKQVETEKIVLAGAVHDKFAAIRVLLLEDQQQPLQPNDLDSVVRRILDKGLEPDDHSH
jgi:hypothetical protein